MKHKIVLFIFASFIFFKSQSQTNICFWDVSTQSDFGINPLPVTGVSPCISNTGLVRGSGVSLIGAGEPRGWGGTGWNYTTPANAIAANAFITTEVTVRDGYSIALSEISPIDYLRTNTGPTSLLFQYKKDAGSFTDITTLPLPSTSLVGASAGSVDLSTIPALQGLPFGTVITFRLVPYGASANSGSFYIYDKGNFPGPDLGISAIVTNLLKFFYSKPTGDLSLVSTWGTNTDGTGLAPSDFITDNRIYKMVNRSVGTINANWTVSGNNTILNIGDSINTTDFIPAGGTTFTLGTGASLRLIVNPKSSFSVPVGTTINLSDNLVTLSSTVNGTGQIGVIKGALNGSSNVTVERAIPSNSRKSYTMVSSPVNSPSISNSWQEGGVNSNGYGTIITGATGTISQGFDAESASGLASIFTYDDTQAPGSKWRSVLSTAGTNLGAGKGFLLYVRGNRTIAPSSTTSPNGNATLRATGTIIPGDTTLPNLVSGAGKFTLIANPYPSAINWTSMSDGSTRDIVRTNVDDIFYVYDPSLGTFASYNGATNTLSPSTSKQPFNFIQSGQAFFVRANGASPSITFTEAAKTNTTTATSNTVFGETIARPRVNINVYKTKDNDFADGVVAMFDNSFKSSIGKEDAVKFDNFNENISLLRNGEQLGMEGRPLVKGNDTLFLSLGNFAKTDYTLVIDAISFKDVTAVLNDNYTGTKLALNTEGATTYNFAVGNEAASAGNERFTVTFGSILAPAIATDVAGNNKLFVKLSPNPVTNRLMVNFKTATMENTVINIVNNLGQVVKTVNAGRLNAGNITIATTDFAPGLYTVQLMSGDKNIATQKIVKE